MQQGLALLHPHRRRLPASPPLKTEDRSYALAAAMWSRWCRRAIGAPPRTRERRPIEPQWLPRFHVAADLEMAASAPEVDVPGTNAYAAVVVSRRNFRVRVYADMRASMGCVCVCVSVLPTCTLLIRARCVRGDASKDTQTQDPD